MTALLNSIYFTSLAFGVGVKIPGNDSTDYSYNTYVSAFVNWAMAIGAALAILMITYGGIKYITSRGDQSAISSAKEIITGSILGFVILLLIYFILKVLNLPASP